MRRKQKTEYPKSGRWVWCCDYRKGHGVDLECCMARCKKPYSSQKKAEEALKQHLRNTWHSSVVDFAWGCGSRDVGYVRQLRKYERWT